MSFYNEMDDSESECECMSNCNCKDCREVLAKEAEDEARAIAEEAEAEARAIVEVAALREAMLEHELNEFANDANYETPLNAQRGARSVARFYNPNDEFFVGGIAAKYHAAIRTGLSAAGVDKMYDNVVEMVSRSFEDKCKIEQQQAMNADSNGDYDDDDDMAMCTDDDEEGVAEGEKLLRHLVTAYPSWTAASYEKACAAIDANGGEDRYGHEYTATLFTDTADAEGLLCRLGAVGLTHVRAAILTAAAATPTLALQCE